MVECPVLLHEENDMVDVGNGSCPDGQDPAQCHCCDRTSVHHDSQYEFLSLLRLPQRGRANEASQIYKSTTISAQTPTPVRTSTIPSPHVASVPGKSFDCRHDASQVAADRPLDGADPGGPNAGFTPCTPCGRAQTIPQFVHCRASERGRVRHCADTCAANGEIIGLVYSSGVASSPLAF